MDVYNRYFRITSGPVLEKAREIEAANLKAMEAVLSFCNEIGAENCFSRRDGVLTGFKFAGTPDQQVWKQPDSFGNYWPRKNSAQGREMLDRIRQLPRLRNITEALKAVGLLIEGPVLISGRNGHACGISGNGTLGVYFVSVPWRDVAQEDLAKYQQEKADGTHWSIVMDHLLWKPTADMVEVKRWEAEKEIEELNARLREMMAQEESAA